VHSSHIQGKLNPSTPGEAPERKGVDDRGRCFPGLPAGDLAGLINTFFPKEMPFQTAGSSSEDGCAWQPLAPCHEEEEEGAGQSFCPHIAEGQRKMAVVSRLLCCTSMMPDHLQAAWEGATCRWVSQQAPALMAVPCSALLDGSQQPSVG